MKSDVRQGVHITEKHFGALFPREEGGAQQTDEKVGRQRSWKIKIRKHLFMIARAVRGTQYWHGTATKIRSGIVTRAWKILDTTESRIRGQLLDNIAHASNDQKTEDGPSTAPVLRARLTAAASEG